MWSDFPCNLSRPLDAKITIAGKRIRVYVHALQQKLGRELRLGYEACHHCDIRQCIEPEHLWEGTRRENQQDSGAKGRRSGWKRSGRPKGAKDRLVRR